MKILNYLVTPFEVLGWAHALLWGAIGGLLAGIAIGLAIGLYL